MGSLSASRAKYSGVFSFLSVESRFGQNAVAVGILVREVL
jgi:hypothetical protein